MQSPLNTDAYLIDSLDLQKSLDNHYRYFQHNNLPPKQSDWWLEISTGKPESIYYFGPFDNILEAASFYSDYIEDLKEKGVKYQEIIAIIKPSKTVMR